MTLEEAINELTERIRTAQEDFEKFDDDYSEGVRDGLHEVEKLLFSVEPRKGKWIYQIGMVKCDQCLRAIRRIDCDGLLNFCPNCGARMTEESE